jgi:CIC family chloride channel protein
VVNAVLRGQWLWEGLLVILAWKLVATAATFGSGAVGGVFTPTLFVGACMGSLFAQGMHWIWPGPAIMPEAFVIVGMGALLAATTHAPIMAIIMLFELTLDYQIILPLMLACVVAHYTCLAFEQNSIYAESLRRKGAGRFEQRLTGLTVADLMKPNPVAVRESADFQAIAECFVAHRFSNLYVIDAEGIFLGAISLHDIKDYLHQRELAAVVTASDIMRVEFPTITPDEVLTTALERFATHDGERLPVTTTGIERRLVGSISKTDLILALAERTKPASKPGGTASTPATPA